MPKAGKPSVAIVGATGAAGSTVLKVLQERDFPTQRLRAFASARGAGTQIQFRGQEIEVAEVSEAGLQNTDIVFFAAGAGTSRRFAPYVAEVGGVAVDKSSAYRMDPSVPLIVPEVNATEIRHHHGIVSNPNCVAIPLTVVLAPLHQAAGLRHVTVATYQAASGGGTQLLKELRAQESDDAASRPPLAEVYPHVLHGNVVPGGWSMQGEDTEEEAKVVAETRRVLDIPDLPMSVTTVRVPVAVGHSMAVWAEFDDRLTSPDARSILAQSAGVVVVDEPADQKYPTPRSVAGLDEVHVGRIRRDESRRTGLSFFVAADNLRKGAATNAVQVAEILIGRPRS
jgi:aspartate-semialdehyde dehydrogenase